MHTWRGGSYPFLCWEVSFPFSNINIDVKIFGGWRLALVGEREFMGGSGLMHLKVLASGF